MVQRFYPCSHCLEQFTNRELILVEAISSDLSTRHWVVCEKCLTDLDDMGILVPDGRVRYEVNYG
jgi:uncharacterized CHY-type Zn-finger protein